MARRSGGTHKGVEEKRRSLPIYEHYTLSPGKTKSHHPEAKCNHCHKEFVCGSKQRLIRHLRKCNNITNPEQIIAETLNTLARNSATGQLNHSILEASNLLPSQLHHHHHHHHQQQQHHQIVSSQQQATHSSPSSTTANSNIINNNNNVSNHNTSGSSSNDTGLIASSSNGSSQPQQQQHLVNAISMPIKRPQRRGRKPANQSMASSSPSIHVTTGLDGKTHFTPASQLPTTNVTGAIGAPIIAQGNGRPIGYTYHPGAVSTTSGTHQTGVNLNHHNAPGFKLNSDPIDKAYLKLVLTRNLPISLCDTKEFQLWVKTFANDYKPPSSINLITQNLKNEAQTAKQRISNILVKAFKKTINLELHCWPDNLRAHLWFAIIANIDLKRFLISVKDLQAQTLTSNTTIANNTTTASTNNNDSTIQHSNQIITTDKLLSDFVDDCIKRVGSDRINSLIFSEVNGLGVQAQKTLYTTHPSIVTYQCWWHFTNLLCSDIVEQNNIFQDVMRNSNRLINFISKRPKIGQSLEKFSPFAGVASSTRSQKNDRRWYSHLVCYLLEYIKNNNEAIIRAFEAYQITQSHLSSDDNNNNPSSGTSMNQQNVIQHSTGTQQQQTVLCPEELELNLVRSIVMLPDYWNNLSLALVYLKPIHDIVALTSVFSTQSNSSNNNAGTNNNESSHIASSPLTIVASPTIAINLSLGDYMSWFLSYGKTLFDGWRANPDNYRYQLIGHYLNRFTSSISSFKLLIAAYLLDPKHKCAYMTQEAKNAAIEEILNIASEFMPEESDGHTIFDQWKLYLVREEPYDVVYEETRTTPLEWWMSLPCAESIRRVALRILRLKAFAAPKPESLFSQLYFYEDETTTSLANTTFEDIAVLRYFYDFEDKIGHSVHNLAHNHSTSTNNASNLFSSNGYQDRTQVGQLHNSHIHQANQSSRYLPSCNQNGSTQSDGQINETLSIGESEERHSYSDAFSDVVVDSYMNHQSHLDLDAQSNNLNVVPNLSLEDLPGYDLFMQYIDYNETGVQIVEEPIEKKRRKWTAQEILSKCHSNQNNNNNNISGK